MARKETSKMSRAVSQLEHIYNKMNADFYGGLLPIPIITVQSKPGTYGHCSVAKVWKKKEGEAYELNIAAEVLSYPIEETLDTMLHEMIHLYCRENNIQECSRGGTYHNKKFKDLAEKVGLECYKTERHGWNTKPGDRILQYAIDNDWTEILIQRGTPGIKRVPFPGQSAEVTITTGGRKQSSTRKYICPLCRQSIRATRDVNIICGDCEITMVKA